VILNIGSVSGFAVSTAYGVSKLAVRGLTVALAEELAPLGIRVNSLAPGLVLTDTIREDLPSEQAAAFVQEAQLIKRDLSTDDLLGAVRLLCSDDGAFITGETLIVGGGILPAHFVGGPEAVASRQRRLEEQRATLDRWAVRVLDGGWSHRRRPDPGSTRPGGWPTFEPGSDFTRIQLRAHAEVSARHPAAALRDGPAQPGRTGPGVVRRVARVRCGCPPDR